MPKFRFKGEQTRTQTWILEVEAETEEAARETLQYAFDEDHGFFHEDTEGVESVTVIDDDGPVGIADELKLELVDEKFSFYYTPEEMKEKEEK